MSEPTTAEIVIDETSISENNASFDEKVFKNTLLTYGASAAFFGALGVSSLLLKPMENYNYLADLIGTELPKIVRNQGADIATVSGLALLELVLMNQLFSNINKEGFANKKAQRLTALLGMAGSAWYALEEATRISHFPEDLQSVLGFTSGTTRGDWGDVLAYSTPIIAGTIYLSKDLVTTVGDKVRNRRIEKSMMREIDELQ